MMTRSEAASHAIRNANFAMPAATSNAWSMGISPSTSDPLLPVARAPRFEGSAERLDGQREQQDREDDNRDARGQLFQGLQTHLPSRQSCHRVARLRKGVA